MLNTNGAKNMMVEHIFDNSTVGLYDIKVQDIIVKNGQAIVSDAMGHGVTVPATILWTDCGDDMEEVWEIALDDRNKIRLSWDR